VADQVQQGRTGFFDRLADGPAQVGLVIELGRAAVVELKNAVLADGAALVDAGITPSRVGMQACEGIDHSDCANAQRSPFKLQLLGVVLFRSTPLAVIDYQCFTHS
jgi:hypothetical protein